MKRRLTVFLLLCTLFVCLAIPVNAQSAATKIDSYITINEEGDCMVNMTVTLHLEGEMDDLTFPLPPNAKNIRLNSSSVRTSKSATAIDVDISRQVNGLTGDFTLRFDYDLPKIVTVNEEKDPKKNLKEKLEDEKKLRLDLPLLSGFSHPVEKFTFVINLPGKIEDAPHFTSVYRQSSIESVMPFVVDGGIITGETTVELQDHDGVSMTMLVSQKMFPSVSVYQRNGNPEIVPMCIFAGLALLYWLIFLRTAPLIRYKNAAMPSDITAGEIGCRVTLSGGDLTMMVLSWAQLGYLLIEIKRSGRVILHKRMEMGNERNLFEIRIFQDLFGNKTAVDATSYQYAKLARRVDRMIPGEKNMCKDGHGNMKIFRCLCCMVQLFCGVCVAMNMTAILALQIILSVVLAVFGLISAWQIQEIAYRTHLRGKIRVFIGLALGLIWVLLGLLAGQWLIPLCSVLGQLLFSYFAAYGGRRTDLNRHDVGNLLGLRRFMKRIPKDEMARLSKQNPYFFYDYVPYALAMGVIKPFAKNFGNKKIDTCPYLITGVQSKKTAAQWAVIIRKMADRMDSRKDRMELERWLPIRFR